MPASGSHSRHTPRPTHPGPGTLHPWAAGGASTLLGARGCIPKSPVSQWVRPGGDPGRGSLPRLCRHGAWRAPLPTALSFWVLVTAPPHLRPRQAPPTPNHCQHRGQAAPCKLPEPAPRCSRPSTLHRSQHAAPIPASCTNPSELLQSQHAAPIPANPPFLPGLDTPPFQAQLTGHRLQEANYLRACSFIQVTRFGHQTPRGDLGSLVAWRTLWWEC